MTTEKFEKEHEQFPASAANARLIAAAPDLYEALRRFASHIGQSGSVVTLSIGKDKWTHSLNTDHFERAFKAVRRAGDYLRKPPRPTEQPAIVGGVDREHECATLLINVLEADPGPKAGAAYKAAREWWRDYDAALTARPSAPAEVEEGEPAEWAVAAERAATEAYASFMGDPNDDGYDDPSDARRAAAMAIERHAIAALNRSSSAPVEPGSERAFRAGWEAAFDWYDNSGITEEWEAETAAYERFARPAADDAK